MLAGRSHRTTWHRRYPFLLERRNGILVHARVLTRDAGTERPMSMFKILSSLVFPTCISYYLFTIHNRTIYARRALPTFDSNSEVATTGSLINDNLP